MAYKPTGKPRGRPKGLARWIHVERAREALEAQAVTAVKLLGEAAKVAAKRGNHAPSAYILEHIAVMNEEGKEIRPIASGIDRQQAADTGSKGLTVNVGWITPTPAPSDLPVIDVRALPESTDK